MSDHIAVRNVGVIQQGGPSREVYEHPVNAFVARFMDHDESAEIWVDSLTGLPADETLSRKSSQALLLLGRWCEAVLAGAHRHVSQMTSTSLDSKPKQEAARSGSS